MNERIRKLLLKATGNPNYKAFRGHFLPPPPDYIDPARVDLEMFAELIVLECAVIVGSMEEPHQDIAKLIKQHFGVEE